MKTKFPLLACLSILLASTAHAQTQAGQKLCPKSHRHRSSLCNLRVLCVSVVNNLQQNEPRHRGHGDFTEKSVRHRLLEQSSAQQWLRYTVKGEEFSVTLPVEPSLKTSEIFVPRLQKGRLERVIEAKAGAVVYRVYVYENPKPRQDLKDFIAEQTTKSDLDLTFERELKIAKFTGQQFSSHDRDFPATEQFFATEGRFYRFVVQGATADHADAQQFFSSVMLGKKQEGIEVLEATVAGGVGPGTNVYTGKQVDTKARLISKPEPNYTEDARRDAVEGTVILKVIFAASGKVTNIIVAQGLPDGLTERAIVAARKIKFVPATKEGKYVSMWIQLEYNFNLY